MKYAQFKEDGSLRTCLIEGIHAIPEDAVKISDEVFSKITQEVDGVWVIDSTGAITKRPLSPSPDEVANQIASARYAHETGGILYEGLRIDTGRDGQALITGAALQAMNDAAYTIRFKTGDGFVLLDSAAIGALAKAVRAHVQACFDREDELLSAVADGVFKAAMLAEGWPEQGAKEIA